MSSKNKLQNAISGWGTTTTAVAAAAFIVAAIAMGFAIAVFVNENNLWNKIASEDINRELLADIASFNNFLGLYNLKTAAYCQVATSFANVSYWTNVTDCLGDKFNGTEVQTTINNTCTARTAQATVLNSTITALCNQLPASLCAGCAPVGLCSYNFTSSLTSVFAALQLLQSLETTDEQFCVGLSGTMQLPSSCQTLMSYCLVDAEYAAYFRTLDCTFPSPSNPVTPITTNSALCTLVKYINVNTCVPWNTRVGC
jgi:hypothetical protein